MESSIDSLSFKIFERESCYYAVLRRLLKLKEQGDTIVSALEIHESIFKPYFPISLERVQEVLVELYNHSLLGRWEYENGEVKYEI